MGDRTHVTLTLTRKHYEQIKDEDWFDDEFYNEIDSGKLVHSTQAEDVLVIIEYEEVNFGELDFLENLQALGIAYDSEWGSGDSYRAGCETCRFTENGEAQVIHLFEGQENPPIEELRSRLAKPIQLVEYIKQYERERTPLPWDNQIEYGKRYQAKQLLKTETRS